MIILFCFQYLPAQGEETVEGELSIWVKNNSQLKLVSMTLELVSIACWDEDHNLTELFNGGTESGYINNGWLEFLCCWETSPQNYYRTFGLGLYKVTAKVNGVAKHHFFIDYRTGSLPGAIGPNCDIDYALDFDVSAEKFYYRYTQNEFTGYHAFWNLRPCVSHTTSSLEDYWDNCLAMIPDADNHPNFIFGPYPQNLQGTITGYKIYRSASHIPGQQPSNFTLLVTLEADEYIYTDNTVTIGNDYSAKSYYVTCIYEDPWESAGETDPTNTVEVRLQIPQKIAASEYTIDQKNAYQLNQNYPNPFNPTTIISYSLPVSNHVTIKVFDILGNEVTTLLNEQKESGLHIIKFDASNLSGGVYFYKIQAGDYTETRKIVLQK